MNKVLYALVLLGVLLYIMVFVHYKGQAVEVRCEPLAARTQDEAESAPGLDVRVLTFTPEEADGILAALRETETEERGAASGAHRAAMWAEDASEAATPAAYEAAAFRRAGVLRWGGYRWTWYSERILPGHGLRIPGRHTDAAGYVRDGDGYLCLATDGLRRGTVLMTPLGEPGRVYDCGCGTATIDVYVGW
jgi:hypothetical protein